MSIADKGQERDMPRTLDRDGQLALVTRAGTGDTAGNNLRTLGQVAAKAGNIFVIDAVNFIDAE